MANDKIDLFVESICQRDSSINKLEAKKQIQELIVEAVENARAADPLKCEFGHEVYSHKTADGWCCACDADIAFLEGQLQDSASGGDDE